MSIINDCIKRTCIKSSFPMVKSCLKVVSVSWMKKNYLGYHSETLNFRPQKWIERLQCNPKESYALLSQWNSDALLLFIKIQLEP